MIKLGMEKYEIDEIEENRPNVSLRKQDAFDQWLRKKHDACWADIIKALFEMNEDALARSLVMKYNWKDPRVHLLCVLFVCIFRFNLPLVLVQGNIISVSA